MFISSLLSQDATIVMVFDTQTKQPIVGAKVRVQNSEIGAYTNKLGDATLKRFQIDKSTNKCAVVVSALGYASIEVNLCNEKPISGKYMVFLKESFIQMKNVEVNANKKAQSMQEVPVSISLIDGRDFNSRQINTLENALVYVPGVEVNRDNVSIRGSSGFSFGIGSRVLMMIDGTPLLSGDNGDIKFEALPFLNIKGVEVIKGAGSALYGTSAIGGVVNVILDEAKEEPETKVRMYSGLFPKPPYQEWEYSDRIHFNSGLDISHSQKINNTSMQVAATLVDRQSFRDFDKSQRVNLFSQLKQQIDDFSSFKIVGQISLEEKDDWVYWQGLNAPFRASVDTIGISNERYLLMTEYKKLWDLDNFTNIKASYFLTSFTNNLQDGDPQYRWSDAASFYAEIQNSNQVEDINLTWGGVFTNNDVRSLTYGNNNQSILSFYSQGEYAIDLDEGWGRRAIITAGLRYDKEFFDSIGVDAQLSPKIGMIWEYSPLLNLRASFGRGFRTPSIAERFSSVAFQGFNVIANPNLKPETSTSLELGFSGGIELGSTELGYDFAIFENNMNNLIEPGFILDQALSIKFDNVLNARIRGIEAGVRGKFFNLFGLESSLTLLDPRNLDSNRVLNYRAEVLWYNRFMLPLPFVEFQADYRYKSRFRELDERLALQINDADARVPVHILDIRFIYRDLELVGAKMNLTLNMFNALNYFYIEMVGNMGMPRHISLQAEMKF